MKQISIALFGILAVILVGCSGSDTYRGSWKATDAKGEKFELFFNAKDFTVRNNSGKKEKFEYSQNSVQIENSVSTYGIQLADGRSYQINFPKSDDESIGLIKDENGTPLYVISRKGYLKYEDVFKLN
ncbi:hypothetical protein [Flavobacterium pectinovorum]|uniref:hypothetical protein n=1 Tax=Flavobacterium pectinovorum TaxID=29533 RepID=UPI001FABD299|nr:hypothetical protein [Flavobacterium pectinovorum]MCI9843741.1 hypothetical protein [Flavobacterium pectinovorum]